jgi:predicted RNA-binding protein YlxR (DUF448 family)
MIVKNKLMRIVNDKAEGVKIDPSGKANGRGAYICKNVKCLEEAKKTRQIQRALKTQIDDKIFEELTEMIAEGPDGR